MFDLRNLEHSNIIYEDEDSSPLLRLAWNQQDSNYIATMKMDSSSVFVLDIRVPMEPIAVLERHEASVNGLAWAPHSSCHMCTAGDDQKALIWDISSMPRVEPILAYVPTAPHCLRLCAADPVAPDPQHCSRYDAAGPINQINWSKADTDWVAIAHDQTVEALRV